MFKIFLYQASPNRNIILDFIGFFPKVDTAKINNDLDQLSNYGLHLLNTPMVKKIHKKLSLYELRIKTDRKIRLLFCLIKPNIFVILHGFVKKTNKLPKKDLEIALKRSKEFI